MRVKPGQHPVRDPHTKRYLPAEGAEVPESTFWIRRLRAGDVVAIAEPTVIAVAESPENATEAEGKEQ